MNWTIPTPDQQIVFLGKIQRLFSEADFSATYKFPLLMSLADLAVEFGDDGGAPLTLSIEQIAEHFIRLYWPQTTPYSTGLPGTATDVLSQNKGRQAAVIRKMAYIRSLGTISAARADNAWVDTVRQIARDVRGMPVSFLQNV